MWLASSTNWGTILQDWYTRSYQVAFSSASPRLCWFWWPGDSGWVKKRPELPTWRGQSIHVQQIFELFWCPMSSDVQRHIDGHWLLAEECCGMLRMREDDFSGMKFLRGSDVFGATKFLTHQGARFSLRGINKCCDWKGRWKPGGYTFSSHHDKLHLNPSLKSNKGHRTNGLKRWKITSNLIVRVSHPLW